MHLHLIDWLRPVHIQSDTKLANQRWNAAVKAAQNIKRDAVGPLLRIFLHPNPPAEHVTWLTKIILSHDAEFPVADNTEEIRLMAGIMMVTTFTKGTNAGDAFALGLRAASFPARRIAPVQPEIMAEADKYLVTESERVRPGSFATQIESPQKEFAVAYKVLHEQQSAGDAAKLQAAEANYHKAVAQAITGAYTSLATQVGRLAEESTMLWWVISEYSELIGSSTSSISSTGYALVAAAEMADRTKMLPPPPSAAALLSRALKVCKSNAKKNLLSDYLSAAPQAWCSTISKQSNLAGTDGLVPISFGLAKYVESGDATIGVKTMANICQGMDAESLMTPLEVSQQFYTELMFLRSLNALPQ